MMDTAAGIHIVRHDPATLPSGTAGRWWSEAADPTWRRWRWRV
jgi:hypothetical protein